MWSLPVPHKIRHFVWRSCRDILPMKTNLMRQKVVQDGICNKCGNKEETPGHVLQNCQKARETWDCSKVASFGLSNNVSFYDFLWQMPMHNRVEEDKVAKVVNIAWALWCNQNKVQNGGKRKSGRELVNWAAIYLDEYTNAVEATCKPTPTVEFQSSQSPPPENLLKVNVNGAVFSAQKAVGIGVIIRDGEGRVEVAMRKKILAPWVQWRQKQKHLNRVSFLPRTLAFKTSSMRVTPLPYTELFVKRPPLHPQWNQLLKACMPSARIYAMLNFLMYVDKVTDQPIYQLNMFQALLISLHRLKRTLISLSKFLFMMYFPFRIIN